MTLRIVPAEAADARAVAEVHVRTWQAAYRGIVADDYLQALSVERREATWRAAIDTGTPRLLVAKRADEVAGWIAFGRSRDPDAAPDAAEVWAVYVAPEHWSGGAGRALWHAARAWLAGQGYRRASLWVIAENARAIRFYRAAGFAEDPGSAKTFTLGSQTLNEVRYSVVLGA